LGSGTSSSRRRITADDVLSLVVPKLAPSSMDTLAESVREAHRHLTDARARLHQMYTTHSRAADIGTIVPKEHT